MLYYKINEAENIFESENSIAKWLGQRVYPFDYRDFKQPVDCGKEFSNWKFISNQQDIDIFFADPGCPGHRCLNEHSNGFLRKHELPKQMDFNEVNQKFLENF